MENVVVVGASPNPLRHSHRVVKSLLRRKRNVIPVGFRKGNIEGQDILTGKPNIKDIDSLLLYMGKKRQDEYGEYILGLKPRKLVFNPGTENPDLQEKAKAAGIKVISGCALVMINAGQI